jgi:serine/threonine protein kinase
VEDGTLLEGGRINVWASLVQQNDDMCFTAMKKILARFESYVPALANGRDRLGRRCLDIASIRIKEELLKCMYFMRRFELVPGPPEHKSETSMVIIATDHGDDNISPDPQLNFRRPTNPTVSAKIIPFPIVEAVETHRKVVLKFMKNRCQYMSEVTVRKNARLEDAFVINILDHFGGSSNVDFKKACQKRGYSDYAFCLVMPLADITLHRVIFQRNIAGKDWDAVRHILKTLCNSLVHIHSKFTVHGDLKPNNMVLIENPIRLIDFDASSYFGDGSTDYAGAKYSTGYLPPELFFDEGNAVKAWFRDEGFRGNQPEVNQTIDIQVVGYDLVRPCPAHDMWAVGVILYLLCTGYELFATSVEGHCGRMDQRHIFEWTSAVKDAKLSNVDQRYARNLLSLLLSKDPTLRPTAERVLTHPFMSGRRSARLQGESPKFDVFLSYRVAADWMYVELMYNILTAMELNVWWDKVSLLPGQPWEEGFCSGLVNSACFVCLLSNNGIFNSVRPENNITKLQSDSRCDNVVLEWRLALELRARGMIEGIFPVMIGNKETMPDGKIMLAGECYPSQQLLPECSVNSIEKKLRDHLDKQGLGSPLHYSMTIKEIVHAITACQGGFLKGDCDIVLPNICESILKMCSSAVKERANVGAVAPLPSHNDC